MAKQEDLRLRTGVEGAEESARAIDQITEAQKKQAQETLNSREASKGAKNEALATITAFNEQAAAERDASSASEALTSATNRLRDAQQGLTQAMITGTIGEVRKFQGEVAIATKQVRDLGGEVPQASAGLSQFGGEISALGASLSAIDPRLGALASQIGAVASVSRGGGTAVAFLSTAMGGLLAAGGAAVGFAALAKSIQLVREESDKLREELRRLKDQQTEVDETAIEAGESIAKTARQRREGGFSADDQLRAQREFEQITNSGRVADTDLLKSNLAALSGSVSPQDIERLTLAGEGVDIERSARGRTAQARRLLARENVQEAAEREKQRVRGVAESRRGRAADELTTEDPTVGEANINEVAAKLFPGLDDAQREEVKRIARDALESIKKRDVGASSAFDRLSGDTSPFSQPGFNIFSASDDEIIKSEALDERGFFGKLFGTGEGTAEFSADRAKKLIDALQQNGSQSPAAAPVTVNNFNTRNTGPGSPVVGAVNGVNSGAQRAIEG